MRKDSEGIDLAILEDLGNDAESYVRSKFAPEVAETILIILENEISKRDEIARKRMEIVASLRSLNHPEENSETYSPGR